MSPVTGLRSMRMTSAAATLPRLLVLISGRRRPRFAAFVPIAVEHAGPMPLPPAPPEPPAPPLPPPAPPVGPAPPAPALPPVPVVREPPDPPVFPVVAAPAAPVE